MTARTKTLSARARANALWDDGDTRTDEELAADLDATLSTIKDYHQQWHRKHGQRHGRKLSPEIEIAVMEMRNNGGMQFPAIAEVLKEDFDCEYANAHLVRECYLRGVADVIMTVEVSEADLPLETMVGPCWSVATKPPNPNNRRGRGRWSDICEFCPHRDECLGAEARHWFVKCERPLQFELMEAIQ